MSFSIHNERYNPEKFDEVLNCSNITFKPDTDDKWKIGFFTALGNYGGKKIDKKTGKVEVKYHQNNSFGRFNTSCGLQHFVCDIRKYISGEYYTDLDIKNCHPTILNKLLKETNSFGISHLQPYIDNREQFYIDYSTNKDEMIKMINNENLKLKKFTKIHDQIYKELLPTLLLKNDNLLRRIKASKKKENSTYNINGSFIAHTLQDYENQCLQKMIIHLTSSGYSVDVLCFDGLMVELNPTLLQELPVMEQIIKETLGFELKIEEKSTETEWRPILKEKFKPIERIIQKEQKLTPKIITDAYYNFTKETGSNIILLDNKFYCCDKNSIWAEANEALIRQVFDETLFGEYLIETTGNCIKFETANEWDNLIKFVKTDIRFHKPKSFTFNDTPELLAYNNKMCVILDRFNKEISYTTRELLPNDYTTITTGYPLLEEHFLDKEYKDYCKSIITNQFQDPETAESYLTIIGMSLYGELLEKKFFINKGYGDNGRSFFANLIHLVFGDYHGTFNSDFFLSKDKQDNDIKSPEAIDNRYKRFITLNEPTASNGFNATTWAIEKIKMFSGNDIIQCRKLQTNTITNYINRSTLMNSLNRVIKFSFIDSAVLERVKVIPQDTQFVDEITLPHHCLKIKDTAFLKTDRFKNCMMAVFIEYWEIYVNKGLVFSKQIEDTTAELLTDKTTDFLNKYYTRTTDTKDFVLLGDIYNLYLRKVSQGKYSIKRPAFKELIISKRHVIKKIDKIINKERINKEAIVFLKRNEEVFDNDEDNTEYEL